MPTERLRVLVTGLSPMLSGILMKAMEQDNTLEPQLADHAEALRVSLARCRPSVLIAQDVEPAMLYDAPRLQVYLLGSTALAVRHLALRPVTRELGELSLDALLHTIKRRIAVD